jgi:hypothetical protein
MIILSELSTVEEYARMCGVKVTTIFYRHHKKSISTIVIDGSVYVDSKASPPVRYLSHHHKKPFRPVTLPGNCNPDHLVSIFSYTFKKRIRPDNFYIMAIQNKIQSGGFFKKVYI